MSDSIVLEPLDHTNWYKVYGLSVSRKQKRFFPIPNVEWIDIIVGLIGGGFDEDGVTGYINPVMIDRRYQGKGYGRQAMRLMILYLQENLHVTRINIGHRKTNQAAGHLYESLGFRIIKDIGNQYYRQLELPDEREIL